MRSLSVFVLLCLAFVVAIWFLLAPPARAHEWYDAVCCSDRDCAAVVPSSVTATAEGWLVYLEAGQHPMLGTKPVREVVPYASGKVRQSGDMDFHVCLSPGAVTLRCLYVPPFGS